MQHITTNSVMRFLFVGCIMLIAPSCCHGLRNATTKSSYAGNQQQQQCCTERHPQFLLQLEDFICKSNVRISHTSVLTSPSSYHGSTVDNEANCAASLISNLLQTLQSESQRVFDEEPNDAVLFRSLCSYLGTAATQDSSVDSNVKTAAKIRFLRQRGVLSN